MADTAKRSDPAACDPRPAGSSPGRGDPQPAGSSPGRRDRQPAGSSPGRGDPQPAGSSQGPRPAHGANSAAAAGGAPLELAWGAETLPALLLAPERPWLLYAFAHGAGAGMEHAFMSGVAERLAERGVATLRWEFPYMAARRGRPDRAPVLISAVRSAVVAAAKALPGVPLIAGGKSLGGRMTGYAQAEEPLPGVRGLAFTGFPLHPPKRPGTERAEPLERVRVPMLFLQGTRDDLAELELVRGVCARLGERARLHVVEGADHGFHVLKRSGRTDAEVLDELADAITAWGREVVARSTAP